MSEYPWAPTDEQSHGVGVQRNSWAILDDIGQIDFDMSFVDFFFVFCFLSHFLQWTHAARCRTATMITILTPVSQT